MRVRVRRTTVGTCPCLCVCKREGAYVCADEGYTLLDRWMSRLGSRSSTSILDQDRSTSGQCYTSNIDSYFQRFAHARTHARTHTRARAHARTHAYARLDNAHSCTKGLPTSDARLRVFTFFFVMVRSVRPGALLLLLLF